MPYREKNGLSDEELYDLLIHQMALPVYQRINDVHILALELPRPEVGDYMLRLIESWAIYEKSCIEDMGFLAWSLRGRGTRLLSYIRNSNAIFSRKITKKIMSYSERYYHDRHAAAVVYNEPLKVIKKEVLGHA